MMYGYNVNANNYSGVPSADSLALIGKGVNSYGRVGVVQHVQGGSTQTVYLIKFDDNGRMAWHKRSEFFINTED